MVTSWLRRRLAGGLLLCPLAAVHANQDGGTPLQLLTGDLPPYAIENNAEQPGVLVELTQAVAAQAGWRTQTVFMPWARALREAQSHPHALVMPLIRTPEREAQFHWIWRMSLQHFSFINRQSAPRIDTLEQARQLKVGVLRGSPHADRLMALGFAPGRLTRAASHDELLRMLELEMVDALYGSEQIMLYNAGLEGPDRSRLQVGLTLDSGEIWLAAGLGLARDKVQRLRLAAERVERDQLSARLYRAYGLELPQARKR